MDIRMVNKTISMTLIVKVLRSRKLSARRVFWRGWVQFLPNLWRMLHPLGNWDVLDRVPFKLKKFYGDVMFIYAGVEN